MESKERLQHSAVALPLALDWLEHQQLTGLLAEWGQLSAESVATMTLLNGRKLVLLRSESCIPITVSEAIACVEQYLVST